MRIRGRRITKRIFRVRVGIELEVPRHARGKAQWMVGVGLSSIIVDLSELGCNLVPGSAGCGFSVVGRVQRRRRTRGRGRCSFGCWVGQRVPNHVVGAWHGLQVAWHRLAAVEHSMGLTIGLKRDARIFVVERRPVYAMRCDAM